MKLEMNRVSAKLTDFPKMVLASSRNPEQKYERVDTHFAVHGSEGGDAAEATLEFGPEKIAVFPMDHFNEVGSSASETTPVYALRQGGTLAVPTGKVFVRSAGNKKIEDFAEQFRKAGYEIAQTLSYAPNAGWLRAISSSIASSLAALDKLSVIPGVENVEPQMLSKPARKQ